MIEVRGLSKRNGETVAVDDLSFDVAPRVATSFLGLNGAGKSITVRMILGLDHPDAGSGAAMLIAWRRCSSSPPRTSRLPGGMLDEDRTCPYSQEARS